MPMPNVASLVNTIMERQQQQMHQMITDMGDQFQEEMEKAFKFLGCNDEQKLICAGYKLQYEAKAWWETTRPILEAAHPVLTWEIFKQAFFGNYFSTSVRKRKEVELAELTQGPKSVLEYQQKFEELFFFAPPHLNNDEAKS
ncbi:uncharacterized protein LOC122638785 [Telopea speciosissima]|uniref:uncharacterized protein LOC122638785 n=1 Tax=Telopea speciosissima TaxID=54955 RepID=UPI001CC6DDB0|nr:uncharacterized protein LOC122638785 [Telopea speciosissima]